MAKAMLLAWSNPIDEASDGELTRGTTTRTSLRFEPRFPPSLLYRGTGRQISRPKLARHQCIAISRFTRWTQMTWQALSPHLVPQSRPVSYI